MRTRSQARRRRQPQVRQTSVESSNLEKPDNPPIVAMADNRTMAQLLEAPTEGYEDAIVIPEITANNFEIKHELHQLDTFYNALNSNDQDSLNSAAGGNFLDKMPRECLKIIESKSKEAIIQPGQTSKISQLIYDHMTANKIVRHPEMVVMSILSGPRIFMCGREWQIHPYSEPIVSTVLHSHSFREQGFSLMEEADSFLALEGWFQLHLKLIKLSGY
ncbi:hypothetical protein Tco_1245370 [Tanacetum coccineum]